MFHIAFCTSTSLVRWPGERGTYHPRSRSVHASSSVGSHPFQGFFFSLIKAFLHPRIKPHTLFWRHHPARIIFFLFVWHCVTQSIPEDASASRWINDRSAQARAGVTRARRGRESAEEERAGEALGRRASRSIVPAYRARAGRRVSPEGRGGTKTRVVLLQHQTTSSRPTDPTDPSDKKRESSCRPAGFTSCRAWGSSGRPRRPSTRARR